MLEIGSIVDGKYKILNKIGQGGMSVVYLAMNEKANKQWAIKEIRKDGTQNYEVVKQGLVAETDILKKLSHPNLPSIIDVIDNDDTFLIVMDYIQGNSLDKAIFEYGAQPQDYVIEWGKQLCDVLSYLHSRKPAIIYRDLKPANIMLKPEGNISIIDFGTAREFKNNKVEDTTCLGTQGYAAPEQFGGRGQTDARTDIYCLGATLYHLVTGHNPAEPPYEMYPITYWNPQLSTGLEKIILKCTMKNPEERYQTCNEVLYALEHYDELDKEYIRKQKIRFGLFTASTIMSIGFFSMAAFFHYKETSMRSSTYDSYVVSAKQEVNFESKMEKYKLAVALNPTKEDAYLGMINDALSDNVLEPQEANAITTILNDNYGKSSVTYEGYFKGNEVGYAEFAYKFGEAYWYYYDDPNAGYYNYNSASTWFSKVKLVENYKGGISNKMEYDNAVIYARMGGYYKERGEASNMGIAVINYRDYWNDLNDLMDIASKDNMITKLNLDNEVLTSIYGYMGNFKNAGVGRSEIENVIKEIENEVVNAQVDRENAELYNKLIEKALYLVSETKTALVSYYDQQR